MIVGQEPHDIGGPWFTEAYRWTSRSGIVFLGDLPGGNYESVARGVSADGAVVVGHSHTASGDRAFRWTQGNGMVNLGPSPGSGLSYAFAVSGDGAVAVGQIDASCSSRAVRWIGTGEAQSLHDRPGTFISGAAYAVSADGSVIAGRAFDKDYLAFVWTPESGMQDLREVLIAQGAANAADWHLLEARGVSADGTTIVGWGANFNQADGFVARITLPIPSNPCYADCDGSGELDVDDFICFQTAFAFGDRYANCDADCALDVDDFVCFQTAFGVGCGQ